jgi:hypothetical protein
MLYESTLKATASRASKPMKTGITTLIACNSDFESNVRDGHLLRSRPAAHRKCAYGFYVTLH